MAEKTSAISTLDLKKLEEQLTCAICCDLYTNPRTLPCLHSFCQRCLEHLPLDSQGQSESLISCPVCRHCTQLPQPAGAAGFLTAFQINNLTEVHKLLVKISGRQQVMCDNCTSTNASSYCRECAKLLCQNCIEVHNKWAPVADHEIRNLENIHNIATSVHVSQFIKDKKCPIASHNESLKIFCKTCEELICQLCAICIHKDHHYDLVSDCYPSYCTELKASLKLVSEKISDLNDAITALKERENELVNHGEFIKEDVHVMVEEMINILRHSEKQLIKDVDIITCSQVQALLERKKSAETVLSQLKDAKKFVEKSLEVDTPQQVVISSRQMMVRMNEVTQQVNIEEFYPKEKATVHFCKDRDIIKTLPKFGTVIRLSFPVLELCKVKVIDHRDIAIDNKSVSFPLSIQFTDSTLLTLPLSSLSCSVVPVNTTTFITTIINTTDRPGIYSITCSPVTSGRHHINIQVNNIQINSTSLVIPFSPYLENITPVRIITNLNKPWGVGVTIDGQVVVSENGSSSVTVLNRDGTKVKSFGNKKKGSGNAKFTYPGSLAISPDSFILVADNHKIQKISMEGKFITTVGKQGSGEMEFDEPSGISISPISGHIFIADCHNHRIQVLNLDLTFSHAFGTEGSSKGQFVYPNDVTTDRRGLVYVADTNNHRIQVFTPEGHFLSKFYTRESDLKEFISPSKIIVDDVNIYITENTKHSIYIFTTDGQFIRSFGEPGSNEGQLNCPYEIAFDREGHLYVCDHYNNRLVVY